jgi:hypothetical protein
MEESRKANRDHTCSCCERIIKKGEYYNYGETREGAYVDDMMGDYVQNGIHYARWYLCADTIECNRIMHFETNNQEEGENET